MCNILIETYQLCEISTSHFASSPGFTYFSSARHTTIDYIFGNQEAAQSATSCQTVEEHPLNTSDHLPICCSFDISHLRTITTLAFPEFPLDWRTTYKDCTTLLYASQVDDFIRPFLSNKYSDMVSLESDLTIISQKFISIANLYIPKKKKRTVHHQRDKIHDTVLSELCWKS